MREMVAAENIPGGFSAVYDVLKAMEESGRVRRGYFVAGLGAAQFALPAAVDLLRQLRTEPETEKPEFVQMAAADPANPYGSVLKWPDLPAMEDDAESAPRVLTRAAYAEVILRNGELVTWLRRANPNILVFLPPEEPERSQTAAGLAHFLCARGQERMAADRHTGILITTVSAALIESWNGRAWSRVKSAALPATTLGELITVSCLAAKSCDAVGYASSSKGLSSLAETWNGKAWTLTTVHWPKGTSNELLSGVSCVAGHRCVAVGVIDSNLNATSNTGKAGAATWNGRAWTVTSVPAPAKGKASLLRDVTCLSAANCVAVGQTGPSGSTNGTGLSAFWNGKSWRLVVAK